MKGNGGLWRWESIRARVLGGVTGQRCGHGGRLKGGETGPQEGSLGSGGKRRSVSPQPGALVLPPPTRVWTFLSLS